MNTHSISWLRYSSSNSAEGYALAKFCRDNCFHQLVHESTRDYLLDLVMSDTSVPVSVSVLPSISDHACVLCSLDTSLSEVSSHTRTVFDYSRTHWNDFRHAVRDYDWSYLQGLHPDNVASRFTSVVLALAEQCVPKREVEIADGRRPWINSHCLGLIEEKNAAES